MSKSLKFPCQIYRFSFARLRAKTTARVCYFTLLPTQHMSIIFFPREFFIMIKIHSSETSRHRDFVACSIAAWPQSLKLASTSLTMPNYEKLTSSKTRISPEIKANFSWKLFDGYFNVFLAISMLSFSKLESEHYFLFKNQIVCVEKSNIVLLNQLCFSSLYFSRVVSWPYCEESTQNFLLVISAQIFCCPWMFKENFKKTSLH